MDLAIIETGNGGDLTLNGNDLALQGSWGNMPYLALFGGNLKSITKLRLSPNEENEDWWGNNLLMPQNQSIQFNSLLEKKLSEIALNSAGRIQIEQTILKDLEFMKSFSEISVTAAILSTDKVRIDIKVKDLNGIPGTSGKEIIFIWDAVNKILGDFFLGDYNDDYNV